MKRFEYYEYLELLNEMRCEEFEIPEEVGCGYFWATRCCLRCRTLIKNRLEFYCEECGLNGIDFCGYCTIFECPLYERFIKFKGEKGPRTAFKQEKNKNKYKHIVMPTDLHLPDIFDTGNTEDPNWRKNLFPKKI